MSKWTQEQFDKDHVEPHDYGEAWAYVIAGSYSDEEAARKISEWENSLTGENRTYTAADIGSMPMVVGRNEDGEEDWCLKSDAKNPVAWGKGLYL